MTATDWMNPDFKDLRYSADSQDAAYRGGAYDYIGEIGMTARMAVIASYLRQLGARRVLDLGCGPAPLLHELPEGIGYVGVDVAEAAVAQAQAAYAGRPNTCFRLGDFRALAPDGPACDALVWAGIGRTWTRKGKGGDRRDWLDILDRAERVWLESGALLVLEVVTAHWPVLDELLGDRYNRVVGCDIDHLEYDQLGRRAIRVLRPSGGG